MTELATNVLHCGDTFDSNVVFNDESGYLTDAQLLAFEDTGR